MTGIIWPGEVGHDPINHAEGTRKSEVKELLM